MQLILLLSLYIFSSSYTTLLAEHFLGERMKKNQMGGVCSTYGWGGEEMHIEFWWEKMLSSKIGVGKRIILKWHFKKWGRGVDWSDLAQDRDTWWALVNVLMNLLVP
jgi:hypothetical protein